MMSISVSYEQQDSKKNASKEIRGKNEKEFRNNRIFKVTKVNTGHEARKRGGRREAESERVTIY